MLDPRERFVALTAAIGTVLSIYGLWVLLSNETERLFERPGTTSVA